MNGKVGDLRNFLKTGTPGVCIKRTMQEEMFIGFISCFTRTYGSLAVKIFSKTVSSKVTMLYTKASEELKTISVFNSKMTLGFRAGYVGKLSLIHI